MTMELPAIPSLPGQLAWPVKPVACHVGPDGAVEMVAGPRTDLFADPKGDELLANSPRVMAQPDPGDFTLSAHVQVDFASTFDAGVLVLWQDDDWWAKLCFEFSPQGEPMIVSVVTRGGVSDDCNSVVIGGNQVHLRVARLGRTLAMHYSLDGSYWHMVRYFTLSQPHQVAVGLSSQSPTGEGCRAVFSGIAYRAETLAGLRDGS